MCTEGILSYNSFKIHIIFRWVFVGAIPPHTCNNATGYLETNFNDQDKSNSATIEFGLLCDQASLNANIQAAPMVGYIIGGIVFGSLSDKFGRKPAFLLANMILFLAGMFCAIAPNYIIFAFGRFVVGMSIIGVESTGQVMVFELVGPSKRSLAGMLAWFFESGGLLMAVGIAYFVRSNWRLLQGLYTLPALLFCIYAWAPPESVRWLLSKKKLDKAER